MPNDNPAVLHTATFDAELRVSQLLQLRDKIDAVKKRHKAELKPFNEAKEQLEAMMLEYLSSQNAKSMRTGTGTFFEINTRSATVKDTGAFRDFVTSGNWDLADLRANAPNVADYITEHDGEIPPGVNFSIRRTLGCRSPTEE